MSGEPEGGPAAVMRAGVQGWVSRLARATAAGRRWSSPALLAVLAAGAFAPLLASGVSVAALAALGIGAASSVGGNVITDLLKKAVDRIGGGAGGRQADLEAELQRRIEEVLQAGGEDARRLRGELARVLSEVGAVGAAIEAAVRTGNRQLQADLAAGLARVGEEFTEFGFVLADLGDQLRLIREGVDRQNADLQTAVGLQYRQATDTRLLLEQVAAIERWTRPANAPATAGPRWVDGSPYRGLVAYSQADAEVFCGRELITAELVSTLSLRLTGSGLLVVTGASGAGKSSLLRAGLLPAVGRGDLSEAARNWPRHVLDQPTGSPLSLLATFVAGLAGLDVRTVLDALKREPADAALLVRQSVDNDARRRGLSAETAAGCRLILVVDQFEEVFSASGEKAAGERAAFIAALHAAATVPTGVAETPAGLVVIAVRGDVIDRCADHPQLVPALQSPFVLASMTEPELRSVITAPAHAAGLEIEAGLVDTILGELRSSTGGFDAGVLPLLSQTMLTIWEHREDHRLTSRGYALTGGVTRAVATSAEAAYDGLDPVGRDMARQMFQRMTVVSPDGRLTRQTMARAELTQGDGGADANEILEVFAGRRLIVVDTGSVQIAHDALLQQWPRLRGWLEADLTGHALRSQLSEDAEDWDRNGRAGSYLYRGERLVAVLHAEPRWRSDPITGAPRQFLDASVHAESRSRRLRRLTLTTLSGLLAAALVLTGVALVQSRTAQQQRAAAQEQQRVATARQLVAKAEAALDTDPRTALRLHVAAHRIHPDAETYASLQRAITTTPYAGQLTGVTSAVSSVAYSASGRYLAAGFLSGAVMLWDLRDPLRPRQVGEPFAFQGFDDDVTVRFASGDRRLATASSSGAVTIWDLSNPEHPHPMGTPIVGERYRVGGAWVSPDGTVLATSSKKNPGLQVWDLTDPARIRPLGRPLTIYASSVSTLEFSPDGTMIAAAGGTHNDPVTLWDIRQHTAPRRLGLIAPQPADLVGSLSFSADGRALAVGGEFRGTGLWNVSDPRNPRPARDHIRVAFGSKVRFSTHGATLATTGGRDTGVLLWDITNPDFPSRTERLVAGEDDAVIAFTPDGRKVATGSRDGHVTLWNLDRVGRPRAFGPPFVGHKDRYQEIYALAMSENGTMIATGGRDTTVALWDVADPARPRRLDTLTGHTGEGVDAVAFAPDGNILATGDGKETVILWDLADRNHPRRLEPSLTGPTNIVRRIVFSADGKTLIVGGDQATIFWDVREPTRPRRLAHVLDKERVLGVWRVRDRRVLALVSGSGTYETPPASAPATTAAAQPTPTTSDSTGVSEPLSQPGPPDDGPGDPNGARLWDITDPDHSHQLGQGLLGHDAELQTAALAPDGRLLVTGDRDGTAILWDLEDPSHPRRLGDPLHPHGSNAAINMVFAPSTDIMVTGGIDQTAYLWDLGNRILPLQLGTALTDNLDTVGHMVFSSNGETLATAGSDGDVVLWDLRPTYELRKHLDETTCLVTNGGLDREQWTRYLSTLDYQDTCDR